MVIFVVNIKNQLFGEQKVDFEQISQKIIIIRQVSKREERFLLLHVEFEEQNIYHLDIVDGSKAYIDD